MKSYFFAFVAVLVITPVASAATIPGVVDDGTPSFIYDSMTGDFSFDPEGATVGLFDARSAGSIFEGKGLVVPSGGLFPVNDPNRLSGVVSVPDVFVFGNIGAGLTEDLLLQDFTLLWSGGLGSPNNSSDLVYLGGTAVPEPAALGLLSIAGVLGFRRRR